MPATQKAHDDMFRYTSGRWIYNEKKRLDERYLEFNVSALLQAAATSVNRQHSDIKSIRKLAEGGFNRVFELTMNDGLQLIARLPYPSTQPKYFATASEVATMELIRHHGVPTPTVYGHSFDSKNSVGAEYIIMEKIRGRCLGDIWFELSDKERVRILGGIVDEEAKLFDIPLPAYGSIYHPSDLPPTTARTELNEHAGEFCVGPDVSLKSWAGTRSQLGISRNPVMTAQEVLERDACKETHFIRGHGRPRLPFDREYREMFDYKPVDPTEHLVSLEKFLGVASHLVPKEEWLHKPVLRHPDLNPNNIFVDDNCNITGIIDWQHTTALPIFLHAGIPSSLQNYGDPESEELKEPVFPAYLDELDEDDRQKDLELYRRRHTHFYYIGATAAKLDVHFKAMSHDNCLFRKKIYQHATEPWEGNSVPLAADLVQLCTHWCELTGSDQDCPLSLDEQKAEVVMSKMLEQEQIDGKMQILRDVIGISSDGWVSNERYEDAVMQVKAMKEAALGYADDDFEREMTEKHWPFDDFDEDGLQT